MDGRAAGGARLADLERRVSCGGWLSGRRLEGAHVDVCVCVCIRVSMHRVSLAQMYALTVWHVCTDVLICMCSMLLNMHHRLTGLLASGHLCTDVDQPCRIIDEVVTMFMLKRSQSHQVDAYCLYASIQPQCLLGVQERNGKA